MFKNFYRSLQAKVSKRINLPDEKIDEMNEEVLEEQAENEQEKDLSSTSAEIEIRTINYETDSNKTETVEAKVSFESKTKLQHPNLKLYPVPLKYFLPKEEEIETSSFKKAFSIDLHKNTPPIYSRKCPYKCYKRNRKCKLCRCRENEIFSLNNAIHNVTVDLVRNQREKQAQKNRYAKKIVLSKESLKTFEKIQLKLNNMKIFYPNVYQCKDNVLDQWGRNGSLTDMNQELLNADELPIKALI